MMEAWVVLIEHLPLFVRRCRKKVSV